METPNAHIKQLLESCKKNNTSAQIQLYKLYYKAMFNSAYRILKDEFEAEDVMQEAFLAAFTKLNDFKGEVTFGAWLKRIVINKSLTQLKKNNRYNEVKMEVVSDNDVNEIEEINYNDVNVKTIIGAINSLKENYRVVLTLNLIEGYDNEEIAQILNYSNENVRTTISRAKKKLKGLLIDSKKQMNANG